MKKSIIYIFIFLLLANCSSFKPKESSNSGTKEITHENNSGWLLFSKGLYYKNQNDYEKAISYLLDAVTYRTELDLVYYHIADCYFNLMNYDSAINFSRMSIERNKRYIYPYTLIFKTFLNLGNYQKAATILEQLLDERPELVNIHFQLAIHYYTKMKDINKALFYFQNIVQISEKTSIDRYYLEYTYYYLGYIYYKQNRIDLSIENLKKVAEMNPDNDSAIYLLTILLMYNYSIEEVKFYGNIYLNSKPGNKLINSYIGRVLYLENNPDAIGYLNRAISTKTIDGLIAKALYLELNKDDLEAEKIFNFIVKKSPRIISSHIGLAKIALRQNDKKKALSEFFTAGLLFYNAKLYNKAKENLAKSLAINDKIPEIYFYLGKAHEETDNIVQAIIYYKKTNELAPKVELIIHLGYLYSLLNRYNDAIKYFDEAIKKEPENPKPHFIKGVVYSKYKKYSLAEKSFKKAIDLKENDNYYFYLAIALEKQKKLNEAVDFLKKAIKFNSNNAQAHNYLGYLYADNNINIDESVALIKHALKIDPFNGAYLDSLGWAYFRQGKYSLALKNLLKAEKQLDKEKSPDPIIYNHIADTYNMMGEPKKAVEYWKKSLKLKKNKKIENKIKKVEKGIIR